MLLFVFQKPPNEWQTRIKLLLALHREMTMNNVYGGQTQKFTEKVSTVFYTLLFVYSIYILT